MIKKYLFLFVLLAFFTCFHTTLAISGACSSHGGVSCSAGPTLDGKVMCNDGWTNSTVDFSEVDECKISSCALPSGSGCKTESDYGALQVKLNAQGGYLGFSASNQSALNQCRAQITQYQSDLQTYNSCQSSTQVSSGSPSSSSYSSSDINSYVNTQMQNYCVGKFGSYSIYDSTKQKCGCASGYLFDVNQNYQCVPESQALQSYCVYKYGSQAQYNPSGDNCSCNSGYQLDKNSQCVVVQPVIESPEPTQAPVTPKITIPTPKIVLAPSKGISPIVSPSQKTQPIMAPNVPITTQPSPVVPKQTFFKRIIVSPVQKVLNWFLKLF